MTAELGRATRFSSVVAANGHGISNGGAVEAVALLEPLLGELLRRDREVLHQAGQVGECAHARALLRGRDIAASIEPSTHSEHPEAQPFVRVLLQSRTGIRRRTPLNREHAGLCRNSLLGMDVAADVVRGKLRMFGQKLLECSLLT